MGGKCEQINCIKTDLCMVCVSVKFINFVSTVHEQLLGDTATSYMVVFFFSFDSNIVPVTHSA